MPNDLCLNLLAAAAPSSRILLTGILSLKELRSESSHCRCVAFEVSSAHSLSEFAQGEREQVSEAPLRPFVGLCRFPPNQV